MQLNKINVRRIAFLSVMIVCLLMGVLVIVSAYGDDHQNDQRDDRLEQIVFNGEVSIDGGDFKPIQIEDFDYYTVHHYRLLGHFSQDITAESTLFFRLIHLQMRLYVNGVEVYQSGFDLSADSKSLSAGNIWGMYPVETLIRIDDVIEIDLNNIYINSEQMTFDAFFNNIYAGNELALFNTMLRENGLIGIVGIAAIIMGLFTVVFAFFLKVRKNNHGTQALWLGLFIAATGIMFLADFSVLSLLIPYPATMTTIYVFACYFMIIAMIQFLACYVDRSFRRIFDFCTILMFMGVSILSFVHLAGVMDLYNSFDYGIFLEVLCIITILMALIYDLKKTRDKQLKMVLLICLPFLLGIVLEGFAAITQVLPFFIWYRFGFVIFALAQAVLFMGRLKSNMDAETRVEDLENALVESQTAVMLSQIQPHFLYNTLTSIRYFVKKDPKLAEVMLTDFSGFLRKNVDSLSASEPIPFARELEHVKYYLSIEQKRFGDRLSVVYAIEVENFKIPGLTIETLVENAVKHGLRSRPEGGTIQIKTFQEGDDIIVVVADDGTGDITGNESINEDRSHIGIDYVRKRIAKQSDGELIVENNPGHGFVVKIRLPQKG